MNDGIHNTKRAILIKELNENGIFCNEKGTDLRDLSYEDLKLLILKIRKSK